MVEGAAESPGHPKEEGATLERPPVLQAGI